MKRDIIALCLMALFAQSVNAQGFFKKLGKALTESAKEIVSGGAVTQETKWGNVTIKHQIPNLTVSLQNVERNGNSAVVTLLFTNTSSSQSKVYRLYHQKTFDSQGNEYNARCQVGRDLLVLGDAWSCFEPNVPTKVFYIINNVPSKAFNLRLLKFESGFYRNGQGPFIDAPIEVRNITVPEMTVSTQATSNAQATKNTLTTTNTQTGAKIFKGEWSNKEGDCYLAIDLYAKSIEVEAGKPLTHGSFAIFYGPNSRDGNAILSAVITGNTAVVTTKCLKDEDGIKVTMKLTYNPANKTITVSDAKADGDSRCLLDGMDPIVLNKKK